MAMTEHRGHWARAVEVSAVLVKDAHSVQLASVSCAGSSCVAVGPYIVGTGVGELAVAYSRGHWGSVTRIPPPRGAPKGGRIYLGQVICGSDGTCIAAGSYATGPVQQKLMVAGRP